MGFDHVRTVLWRASSHARVWGVPGSLGAVLFGAAIAAEVFWAPRLRDELQVLQTARQAGLAKGRAPIGDRTGNQSPEMQARLFVAAFPDADSRDARVARLFELMQEHALSFSHVEFQTSQPDALELAEYRMSLPLRGSYGSIREFIADALMQDAALSLDQLHLHRAGVAERDIEADMVWAFHMQDAGVQQAAPGPTSASTLIDTGQEPLKVRQ